LGDVTWPLSRNVDIVVASRSNMKVGSSSSILMAGVNTSGSYMHKTELKKVRQSMKNMIKNKTKKKLRCIAMDWYHKRIANLTLKLL